MLLNFATLSLLIISLTTVVLCNDVITNEYRPDSNQIIKRLHGSTYAKLFLHGCDADPYINLTTNETATESKSFKMHKSKEYLFAIFTLDEVSIILSNSNMTKPDQNATETNDERDETEDERDDIAKNHNVLFNLTLGMYRVHKNAMAMLKVYDNETLIGSITQRVFFILPTIPFYINVSISEDNISVFEARTGAVHPFLQFNFSRFFSLKEDHFFVKFQHSSPIYAHYDCCETCSPWIYTRISGCSKYSARTASIESETTYSIDDIIFRNQTENILLSQNIIVNHDGSPTFAAKIIFSESVTGNRGNRYEIVLSNTPTIAHHYNSSAQNNKTGETLKREYTLPFIVNITITRDGIVRLKQPYEEHPFLVYAARKLKPVNVKYMKMVKVHEDFVRYDFFYNCTDLLWITEKDKLISDANVGGEQSSNNDTDIDSYPQIWKYTSKQFNTMKYDVLHVFQDSYQIYEKSHSNSEDNSGNDEESSASSVTNWDQSSENKNANNPNGGTSDFIKKGLAGISSFLFIGILKYIFSLEFVKNLMTQLDVDDDQAKGLRQSVSKNLANKIGGFEIDYE